GRGGWALERAGVGGGDARTADQVCRPTTTTSGKVQCTCQQQPPPPCGQNPLAGACAGECTDPTQKCLPDVGGACTCQPPPGPGDFCGSIPGGGGGGDWPHPPHTRAPTTPHPHKPCIRPPAPCPPDSL